MAFVKLFDVHKRELSSVILFCALFGFLELGGALSFSVAEAMFISGLGVESLPLAYVLLFCVMLCAMSFIAYMQSKFSLDKVMGGLLISFLVFICFIASSFTFFEVGGLFKELLLYALKLGAAVWVYASFSLYWNFADEHFSIRDGKRLYALFSAFGCLGAVLGAGAVYIFSEYLKIDTSLLLWIWAGAVVIALPIFRYISLNSKKLDSGVDFEAAESDFKSVIYSNIKAMSKSSYVRGLFALYLFVIFAAVLNEYSVMYAFSDYATAQATNLFGQDSVKIAQESQLKLASIFGALGVGVNVFNFAVNLFFFNKLVSKFGVGNLVALQPLLYMIAFTWLINSFGMPAAIFSFFMYRGMMESVDANNVNLMISILPSSVRQQVRLILESFMVPFATALAGLFLMLYAKGESSFDFASSAFLKSLSEFLGFGTLTIIGICIFGFFMALIGFISALILKREYPKILENNLRSGSLDFSENLKSFLDKSDCDLKEDAQVKYNNAVEVIARAELSRQLNPKFALNLILKNADLFRAENLDNLERLLSSLVSKGENESLSQITEWLLDENEIHSASILNILAKFGVLDISIIADIAKREPEISQVVNMLLQAESKSPSASVDFSHLSDIEKAEKLRIYRVKENGLEPIFGLLNNENRKVRKLVLELISENIEAKHIKFLRKLAEMFKDSSQENSEFILKALLKVPSYETLEPLLLGVSKITPFQRREILDLIDKCGSISVPTLVYILKSDKFSYAAKSVCAMGLYKIFPAQLKMLAHELFELEIRNAYLYVGKIDALLKSKKQASILVRIFEWQKRSCISFIILLFALCGKVSSFESLENALFSKFKKELATALESLEQTLSADEYAQLLPLVDGRESKLQLSFAKARYGLEVEKKDTMVLDSAHSAFDEEFLASSSILLSENSHEFINDLCFKIGSLGNGKLRFQLLDLFDEMLLCGTQFKEPSIVNKFSGLAQSGYFDDFEPPALSELALECEFKKSCVFKLVESAVVIRSNSMWLNDASWEILKRDSELKVLESGVLLLPISAILRVSKNYPEAAISIFRKESEGQV